MTFPHNFYFYHLVQGERHRDDAFLFVYPIAFDSKGYRLFHNKL